MRHLRLLHYIVETARSRSIRQVAEKLNITASALKRRIQDLEDELGAQLFERMARGGRLTAVGETFVQHAQAQLAEADQVRSQIEDLEGLRRDPLRIACSQAVATDFPLSQIALFEKDWRRLTFETRVTDHDRAAEALMAYEVELAVIFRWPCRPLPSNWQRKWRSDRSDFESRPSFPLRRRAVLSVSD